MSISFTSYKDLVGLDISGTMLSALRKFQFDDVLAITPAADRWILG